MDLPGTAVLQLPDGRGGGCVWRRFHNPCTVIQARSCAEVLPALAEIAAATRRGLHAVGFIAYEAAPAFDAALAVHPVTPGGLPLLWFGLYAGHEPFPWPSAESAAPPPALEWRPEMAEAEHQAAIRRVKAAIAAGATYQVNLTLRLEAAWPAGVPAWPLFAALCQAQQPLRHGAFLDLGGHALLSASPELFFELDGGSVTCRPMKGTAPRGRTTAEDAALAAALRRSAKDRAENVMIVDMVRNDLGRIAEVGSVRVRRLFEVERYATVHQLTSTVTARTRAPLPELLRALFPCASITGAPKVATMRLIRELEPSPRGIYTGGIGWIGPAGQARFNVAIRTVHLDRAAGCARFGTGGGIVWDSTAEKEWAECQTKALVLTARRPAFSLLETLRWTPARGFVLRERHLARLADSAAYFGFPCALAALRERLAAAAAEFATTGGGGGRRVRLLLAADGTATLEAVPFTPERGRPRRRWRLALAREPVDASDVWLYHKTTRRETYEAARAGRPEVDDVILWNAAGEVTETTLANLAVKLAGVWVTPPVGSGLLPGTLRAALLERGRLRERVVTIADLERAEEIALFNSLRGWIPARLA
ncbi:MAG: aminodeoxychorismate synthase component I [Lentisphaeria bacterium]|jgi:para-aminobenzoate synthetase/4-amino-4-deoxychorismate lyase